MRSEYEDDVLYEVLPNGAIEFVTRGRFNNWYAGDTLRIAIAEPIDFRPDEVQANTTIKSATFRLRRRDANIYYADRI